MPKHRQKYLNVIKNANMQIDYQDLVDRRREEVEEIVIEKNKDFRTKNILTKAKDIKKEKLIIKNKSYKALYSGFINSKNKENYISQNRQHIKSLPINQQRNLISTFLIYL
jgi:hypothetical protein